MWMLDLIIQSLPFNLLWLTATVILLKYSWTTVLLRSLQLLPVSLRVKPKVLKMTFKALGKVISITSVSLVSLPSSAFPFSHTGFLTFLEYARHSPASGWLYLLDFLPGQFFQLYIWPSTSSPLSHCSLFPSSYFPPSLPSSTHCSFLLLSTYIVYYSCCLFRFFCTKLYLSEDRNFISVVFILCTQDLQRCLEPIKQ